MIFKIIAISLMMMSSAVHAYNVLIVAPVPYKSHWIFMESIIDRLKDKGHYVSVITPFHYKFDEGYHSEYLKEYIIPKFDVEKIYPSKNIFNGMYESDISYIQMQYKIGLAISEHTLSQPKVKEFINRKDHEFDAVLVDSNYLDSLYMFAKKFKCPLIALDVVGVNHHLDEAMGIMTPHSFVPHPVSKYKSSMSFLQRCYNALLYVYEAAVRRFSYIPAQNRLAMKHFRDGIDGELPHIQNVIKNISLVLSNNFRMSQNRPKMSSQIDVAGLHLENTEELPDTLYEIISNSHSSVIYFSFGSYLKPSEMPKEKIDAIIKAFANVKKTILWQYDGEAPVGLPENVIVQKWLPQNDLLENKRVVLFITQGGTLSYQEGLQHNVPMLIIPFNREQYRNARDAEEGRYGKMLLFDDLNEKTLTDSINEILNDNSYFTHIENVFSKLLRQPIEPAKEAVFWIQHVCKHKGIEKSPAIHLSWFTYYQLDVFAFYISMSLACILFWVILISYLVRRYQQREQKGKFKYY